MMDKAITHKLLRAMRSVEGRHGEWDVRVTMTRKYGRRTYRLDYLLPWLVDGHAIRLDVTNGELWCAPTYRDDRRKDDGLWDAIAPALAVARDVQREYGTPIEYPTPSLPGFETYRLGTRARKA